LVAFSSDLLGLTLTVFFLPAATGDRDFHAGVLAVADLEDHVTGPDGAAAGDGGHQLPRGRTSQPPTRWAIAFSAVEPVPVMPSDFGGGVVDPGAGS